MLPKLIRYLRKRPKVGYLVRDLTTPYSSHELTPDDELILMTRRAKDLHGIERLKKRHAVSTAAALYAALPVYKLPPMRKRLLAWLRRLEGSTATDPVARELAQAKRQQQNVERHGIRPTRLR